MQDVGDDIAPLVVGSEVLGERRAQAGTGPIVVVVARARVVAALAGVRAAAGAEELDAHVRTARAVGADTELGAARHLAARLVGPVRVRVVAAEAAARGALRVDLADAVLCPTKCIRRLSRAPFVGTNGLLKERKGRVFI